MSNLASSSVKITPMDAKKLYKVETTRDIFYLSYDMPIAYALRNGSSIKLLDKADSPSSTTTKHISFISQLHSNVKQVSVSATTLAICFDVFLLNS